MADKIYPKDGLGNEIRVGKLIRLELPEAAGLFYVMSVNPATVIHDSDNSTIPVNGEIEIAMKMRLPFHPGQNSLQKALVVEQPKQEEHSGLQ